MNKHVFYKSNFIFKATRYEEWQGGNCISNGAITTKIIAEVQGDTIHFELDDIKDIRILKSFDFEILGEDYCILPDRIQYVHSTSDLNPISPIVCNIFFKNSTVDYVRFAMTNPDRLVEFHGELLQVGQESTGCSKRTNINENSAESILGELRSYGMLNTDAIMERAVKLYNNNSNVSNKTQVYAVIESLKLFVKAYQLNVEEKKGGNSMLKPKLLMFLALCNYKIDNINRAYCIAKQGLDAIDAAIEDSPFIGIPRSVLGADTLQELINFIETKRYNEVENNDNYYAINPEEIDLKKFKELMSRAGLDNSKPSKEKIKQMIDIISHIQSELSKISDKPGDELRAFQIDKMFETFKLPLYFAWQGYKYGWHTDFCEEGDSLFPFLMFEADLKKNTQDLIEHLKSQSPFVSFERNSAITNSLISIYSCFISDLEKGIIRI